MFSMNWFLYLQIIQTYLLDRFRYWTDRFLEHFWGFDCFWLDGFLKDIDKWHHTMFVIISIIQHDLKWYCSPSFVDGRTYFLLACLRASDSSSFMASARNFLMFSFISLFLFRSCFRLSRNSPKKPLRPPPDDINLSCKSSHKNNLFRQQLNLT